MKWWRGLIIGLTVTGVAIVGSCMMCSKAVEKALEETELIIIEHEMTIDEWGVPLVTGRAKNTSDSKLTLVTVEVRWHDAEGNLIGESSDYIGDLKPGEVCKFEVYGYGVADVAGYEVEGHGW